jgi:hypothetical protein
MPKCPLCGFTYPDGVNVCPDCNINLIDEKPEICIYCGAEIEPGLLYCPECGKIFTSRIFDPEDEIECEEHINSPAVGICVICGKPVCSECSIEVDGKIYCKEGNHRQYDEDWVVIYTTQYEYEAEMLKANIESAGIPCVVFSTKDHSYFMTVGFGIVKILVPKNQKEIALKIIEDLRYRDENLYE